MLTGRDRSISLYRVWNSYWGGAGLRLSPVRVGWFVWDSYRFLPPERSPRFLCVAFFSLLARLWQSLPSKEAACLASPPVQRLFRVDRGPVLLVVIRGGGIALEFGCVYEILGSPFTVLEMTSTSLPCATDAAIAGRVQSILQHRGMALQTGASVHEIVQGEEVLKVIASESVSEAQNILIATGRWPTPSSLNPTGLGLRMSGRAINIDNFMATNPSEVWAACGTVPGPMLAHKAMMEGRVVGEDITGGLRHADHRSVPKVIFTRTEVPVWTGRSASVNQRRRNQGFANPDVYQSSRAHPGRRRWSRSVELRNGPRPVPASPSARPHVTDWIAEGALAVTRGATVDDLTGTSHAYPVSPEPMLRAALGFQGAATHMQSR